MQPIDQLLRDQRDFAARLLEEPALAQVAVLLEEKGVTEADVQQALTTLNPRGDKIGAVLVVLMPVLVPETPDAPGPRSRARLTVQAIETPLYNRGAGGTGLPATALALHVRSLLHRFSTGLGAVWSFAGQEPVPVDEGNVSLGISFERPHQDSGAPRASTPLILGEPDSGGTLVSIQAEPGATIRYTLSPMAYPALDAETTEIYAAPFVVPAGARVRAVAALTGKQTSNIAEEFFA